MEFGRDDIYYGYLKNAGGLSDVCEDHPRLGYPQRAL